MTTMKFKLLASAAMIVTLAGGVGTGVYFANAGDDPQKPSAKAKADPTKKADEKPRAQITEISNETAATIPTVSRTTAETTQLLSRPVPEEIVQDVNYQVGELFTLISNKFGITVRAEDEYLKNMGIDSIYEKTVRFRFNPNKLSLEDLLTEIKSQIRLEPKVGFRVKANQLIFGHVYSLCTQSLSNQKNNPDIDQTEIIKDMHGPRISISVEGKSLSDIAEYLREQTGANIIINSRQHVNLDNKKVTVTLNNATVYTILKVVSDLYNLAPAIVDNVYYITDIKAAEKLNRETAIALFGEEIPMVVYVPVNQDGKFMPPGPEGFRSQKFKFIPVRVEEVDKAKDTAKPKVEEKKP